jgi:hypothetical protein
MFGTSSPNPFSVYREGEQYRIYRELFSEQTQRKKRLIQRYEDNGMINPLVIDRFIRAQKFSFER